MEDEVGGGCELVGAAAVVVGAPVPGVVEADFGAELDGGADPLVEGERVLGVAGLVAGALAFLVVEEVGPEGEIAVLRELFLDVVGQGVLGREAAQLAGMAEGAVVPFSGAIAGAVTGSTPGTPRWYMT